jgi:hypothetical protein
MRGQSACWSAEAEGGLNSFLKGTRHSYAVTSVCRGGPFHRHVGAFSSFVGNGLHQVQNDGRRRQAELERAITARDLDRWGSVGKPLKAATTVDWSHNAEARMSALPRTNDLVLAKGVAWAGQHHDVSKLWWQGERARVSVVAGVGAVFYRRHCGSLTGLVPPLAVYIFGRRCDLGSVVLRAIDPALRSGAIDDEPATETASKTAAGKQFSWAIYRLKGTPAKLLGNVKAPNEESAIKKTIEEFSVTDPQQQKRLLARRRG